MKGNIPEYYLTKPQGRKHSILLLSTRVRGQGQGLNNENPKDQN